MASGRVAPADVEALAGAVGPVCAADERVRFAYVFGSVAVGTATGSSDVDLGLSALGWTSCSRCSRGT